MKVIAFNKVYQKILDSHEWRELNEEECHYFNGFGYFSYLFIICIKCKMVIYPARNLEDNDWAYKVSSVNGNINYKYSTCNERILQDIL